MLFFLAMEHMLIISSQVLGGVRPNSADAGITPSSSRHPAHLGRSTPVCLDRLLPGLPAGETFGGQSLRRRPTGRTLLASARFCPTFARLRSRFGGLAGPPAPAGRPGERGPPVPEGRLPPPDPVP